MIEKSGQNEMSTAELIYKFFDFYSNKFKGDKFISIKQGGFISKTNKSDKIAFSIDDPFQVEHNPGQSITLNSMSYKTTVSKYNDLCEKVKEGKVIFELYPESTNKDMTQKQENVKVDT